MWVLGQPFAVFGMSTPHASLRLAARRPRQVLGDLPPELTRAANQAVEQGSNILGAQPPPPLLPRLPPPPPPPLPRLPPPPRRVRPAAAGLPGRADGVKLPLQSSPSDHFWCRERRRALSPLDLQPRDHALTSYPTCPNPRTCMYPLAHMHTRRAPGGPGAAGGDTHRVQPTGGPSKGRQLPGRHNKQPGGRAWGGDTRLGLRLAAGRPCSGCQQHVCKGGSGCGGPACAGWPRGGPDGAGTCARAQAPAASGQASRCI
jgi:hypothetical protein